MKAHHSNLQYKQRLIKAQTVSKNMEPQCDICHKTLPDSKHQDHKFIHYNIKPYNCDLCHFSAHTKEILKRHVLKHKSQRTKRCFYCSRDFPSEHLRNEHIRATHSDKMLICDFCGEKLLGKLDAKKHFRKHQSNVLPFECERCPGGVRFPNKQVLTLHHQQHEREDKTNKQFACRLCERKLTSESAFKKHLRYHERDLIIACHICGKSVAGNEQRKIYNHLFAHQRKKKREEMMKCDLCQEEFIGKNKLERHMRNIHNPNNQSCYRCGKMIPEYFMSRHLKFCSAGELRCQHCPMTFTKESARQLHNNKVHTGFKCKRCNIIFENRAEMDWHQRYDEYHLRTKSKKNVGVNEMRCKFCPMRFEKKSARFRHYQEFHIGFKCNRCNMDFDSNSALKWHQRHDETHLKTMRKPLKQRLGGAKEAAFFE